MQRAILLVLCGCLVVACSGGDGRATVERDAATNTDDAGDDDAGAASGSAAADGGSTQIGECNSCAGCDETIAVKSANHVVGTVDYRDRPPVGGDHNQCWGDWGVHDKPLAPERWVHNLEHGGVVLLYNCPDGCAAEVKQLASFVKRRSQSLLTAYTDMPTRFAAVAWGQRIKSTCLDLDVFAAFYSAHVNHSPESVTSGAPAGCPP